MDILEIKVDMVKLSPSVTDNYVDICIDEYSGPIETKIYALNGNFMGIQSGNKLSFKKFKSGVYFCVVVYGGKNATLRVVKV